MLQQPQPPLPLSCGWEARSGVNPQGRWTGPVPRISAGSRRRRGAEGTERAEATLHSLLSPCVPRAGPASGTGAASRAASRAAGSGAARPCWGVPGGAGHAWRAGPAGKGACPADVCAGDWQRPGLYRRRGGRRAVLPGALRFSRRAGERAPAGVSHGGRGGGPSAAAAAPTWRPAGRPGPRRPRILPRASTCRCCLESPR